MIPSKDRYSQLRGGRWGGNDQPEFYEVVYILGLLPIEEVKLLAPDRLYIRMYRCLTFWEAFILGRLNPDDPPEGINDMDTEFVFWWD